MKINTFKTFFAGLCLISLFFLINLAQAQEIEEVEQSLVKKDLREYKIGFLRKPWLNFELRLGRDPARKLEIAFQLLADSYYRLDRAKDSENKSKIKRLLAKYSTRTRAFEKNLEFAQAVLADLEIEKILGLERILAEYRDISREVINVAYGLNIIFAEDEGFIREVRNIEEIGKRTEQTIALTANEIERMEKDPVYKEYVRLMNSPNLSKAQKGLLTLNYFKAQREGR